MRIVDGGMIAFAAYHVLKGKVRWPLTFQVPRMIRVLAAAADDAFAVVWNPDRVWKEDLWPRYQAGRPEIWDLAGRDDYDTMLEVLAALGAVQYRTDGLESDEVMAALVHRLRGAGRAGRAARKRKKPAHEIVLVTDDKDFFQLLAGGVRLEGRVRGTVRARDVKRIMGVTPAYVADYQALTGDATDGIPRVVSPAAALRLIATRGHVREWIDRRLRLSGPLGRRIEAGRAQIKINLELVDLSPAAVFRRGAPGRPLPKGSSDPRRLVGIAERTGVGWLREATGEEWAPIRRGGERARRLLGI
jgi:5'-3' exonuclease